MQEMLRARRFARWLSLFWIIISALMLVLFTAFAIIQHPTYLHTSRGLALAGAVALYAIWFAAGYRWLIGKDRYWQAQYIWRRALYWVILLGCTGVLMLADPMYANMLWVAFGTGIGIIGLPWGFLCTAVTSLLLLWSWGLAPPRPTPDAWFNALGGFFSLIIYSAILYLPTMLLQHRFRQARLFQELQIAHEELAAAHAQMANATVAEREVAVLRERERLARDMHDTLGHALVLATVKLEAAHRLLPVEPTRADEEIQTTQDVLRHALRELRATLGTLRQPDAACETLEALLNRIIRAAGIRAGWQVTTEITACAETWPPDVRAALARIGGEAIANAERHARAHTVHLVLHESGDLICLEITDDGVGLPELPRTLAGEVTGLPGHFGLAGMRERAAEIGGVLTLTALPEGGTCVQARIPASVILAKGATPHE
jgi:signal transduction histidine kinase